MKEDIDKLILAILPDSEKEKFKEFQRQEQEKMKVMPAFTTTSFAGNTDDLIHAIVKFGNTPTEFSRDIIEMFRKPTIRETCAYIQAYWNDRVTYEYDRSVSNVQLIQSPGALFESKKGDCKSFIVAYAHFLTALGIEFDYRFISQSENKNYHYCYIMAYDENGKGILMDPLNHDSEVKYARLKQIKGNSKYHQ